MNAGVPVCLHGSADQRMCPDCRVERITGQPAATLADLVNGLADELAGTAVPDRSSGLGGMASAPEIALKLRQILDRIGWAGLPKEDLHALLASAVYGVPPHSDVVVRAAEVLADRPVLRRASANAVPQLGRSGDHVSNSTSVEYLAGRRMGDPRDPDPS